MLELIIILLPIAAVSGWLAGYHYRKSKEIDHDGPIIPHDYFLGLNYLINDRPDKAVDVFIKMLEVNSNTVETHLALGNLFRRRGEVDRAIRIHQNLIARPQLPDKYRMQALLELAQDYLRAGVFDRAERLFLELIQLGGDAAVSFSSLINIYQQQKDWQQAITTAKKLEDVTNTNMQSAIAHYYCELAEQARTNKHYEEAEGYLKNALKHDKHCARASIILGQLLFAAERYKEAIKVFKIVYDQDAEYVSEIIDLLVQCYKKTGQNEELFNYLTKRINESPRIYYILAYTDYLLDKEGEKAAIDYLVAQIPRCLSLRGLKRMLELYISHADDNIKPQLSLLKNFISKLLENKPVYRCCHCGFACKNLYWQCPSCRRWNGLKPIHGLEGD